jgi:hypothetical protein
MRLFKRDRHSESDNIFVVRDVPVELLPGTSRCSCGKYKLYCERCGEHYCLNCSVPFGHAHVIGDSPIWY